jgi:hypothetical protein
VVVIADGQYRYACPTGLAAPPGPPPQLEALTTGG